MIDVGNSFKEAKKKQTKLKWSLLGVWRNDLDGDKSNTINQVTSCQVSKICVMMKDDSIQVIDIRKFDNAPRLASFAIEHLTMLIGIFAVVLSFVRIEVFLDIYN